MTQATLTENKLDILNSDIFSSYWINASAGTGKTKLLIDRIINLLVQKQPLDSILAITFTKLAANEMKERLLKQVYIISLMSENELQQQFSELTLDYEYIKNLYNLVINNLSDLKIQTIHGFCQSLLKTYPIEAGIDPNFEVMDQHKANQIKDQAKHELFKEIGSNEIAKEQVKQIINNSSTFSFDDTLNEIITYTDNIIFLIGIYGSYNDLLLQIKNYLHITVDNIYQVLEQFFNTLNLQELKFCSEKLSTSTALTDQKRAQILLHWLNQPHKNTLSRFYLLKSQFITLENQPYLKPLTKSFMDKNPAESSFFLNLMQELFLTNESINNIKIYELTKSLINLSILYIQKYEAIKQASRLIDYNDIIRKTLLVLAKDNTKSFVNYKLSNSITHILLDEAQDTNPYQWNVVLSLIDDYLSGGENKSIFIVGDEKQSIYGFNGSDINNYFRIKSNLINNFKHLENDLNIYTLYNSYRSSNQVLAFVDLFFNKPDNLLQITQEKQILHIPNRNYDGQVIVHQVETNDEVTIHTAIAQQISSICENIIATGANPNDIMILFRTRNILMTNVIECLDDKNIPHSGIDKMSMVEIPIFRTFINFLSFLANPYDNYNLYQLLFELDDDNNMYEQYIISNTQESFWEYLSNNSSSVTIYQQLLQIRSLKNLPLSYVIISIFNYIKNENINEIKKLILKYSNKCTSIDELIQELKKSKAIINQGNFATGIKLMTVHASKGLESKTVILADTLTIPTNYKNKIIWKNDDQPMLFYRVNKKYTSSYLSSLISENIQEDNKEYLRLLYVALTRARDELHIVGNEENAHKLSWFKNLVS